jgi:hypothetical protein
MRTNPISAAKLASIRAASERNLRKEEEEARRVALHNKLDAILQSREEASRISITIEAIYKTLPKRLCQA